MKNLITTIALAICTCASSLNVYAQKIGHLDVDSLMKIWPAYQKVVDSLADTQITFQKQAQQMYNELVKQQELIDSMKPKDSPLVAELRITQLMQMQSNYEQFIQLAEQQIKELQIRLSDTLYKQMDAAIVRVAKAEKFTYILDSSKGGQVMYADPTNDVFDLVRQELKIPIPVKKTVQEPVVPVMGGR
jgi:outer membrane protein